MHFKFFCKLVNGVQNKHLHSQFPHKLTCLTPIKTSDLSRPT